MALETLITAIAERPVLYDLTLFAYRDQIKTADAWKKVALVVGLPDSECKKKWKYLRGQLRKERNNEKEKRKSGAGASRVKPWRYAAVMSFLNPFLGDRSTSSNMEGGDSESEEEEEEDDDDQDQDSSVNLDVGLEAQQQDDQPSAAEKNTAEQSRSKRRRLTRNGEFEERMQLALAAVSNEAKLREGPCVQGNEHLTTL